MATVLDIQSNRAIQLSGAEKMTRTFVKDPNAVDIRIGIAFSADTGGDFNPTTSIYETFQLGLISSLRSTPINSNVTPNISSISDARITFGGKVGSQNNLGDWYAGISQVAGCFNTYELKDMLSTTATTGQPTTIRLGYPTYNQGSVLIVRIYKITPDGSQFGVQFRRTEITPSAAESQMHDILSNLASSELNGAFSSFTFTCSDGSNWDALDTVMLAWPFYGARAIIHSMGYRSLHA